jgi:membrane protease YdiL (CAAX protease family)
MSNQSKRIVSILTFFSIAISLRYYIDVIKPNFLLDLHLYLQILLLGVGPLIGGLVVVKIFKRPNFLKILGINIWKTITIVAIPMLLFSLVGVVENGVPSINLFKFIGILILYALFEEYGWRNYLQSELSDLKKVYKYLIITILWFAWHLNFELSISNLIFFLALFAGSYGIGFMADRSKSLILSALFHSFFNISQTSLLGEVPLNYKLIIIAISAVSAILIMKYGENRNASINLSTT